MEAEFPHFFICIFQDFSCSKLRFSRTIISESEDCQMFYDHLSPQEKYSILTSYLFKKFLDFLIFSFPGLEIHLNIFLVLKVFQGVWEPWEGDLFNIKRAEGHCVFMG